MISSNADSKGNEQSLPISKSDELTGRKIGEKSSESTNPDLGRGEETLGSMAKQEIPKNTIEQSSFKSSVSMRLKIKGAGDHSAIIQAFIALFMMLVMFLLTMMMNFFKNLNSQSHKPDAKAPEVSEDPEAAKAPNVSEDPEAAKAPNVSEDPEAAKAPNLSEAPEAPKVSEDPTESADELNSLFSISMEFFDKLFTKQKDLDDVVGKDGTLGQDGTSGKDGTSGQDGISGKDGVTVEDDKKIIMDEDGSFKDCKIVRESEASSYGEDI
jgi:hypothetical protein